MLKLFVGSARRSINFRQFRNWRQDIKLMWLVWRQTKAFRCGIIRSGMVMHAAFVGRDSTFIYVGIFDFWQFWNCRQHANMKTLGWRYSRQLCTHTL